MPVSIKLPSGGGNYMQKGGLCLTGQSEYTPYVNYPINCGAVDGDYIYVCKSNATIKFNKSDLTTVTTATQGYLSATIKSICVVGDYVYIVGVANGGIAKIYKYAKSDLALIEQGYDYTSNINSMACDGTHLYIAGSLKTVVKVALSDISAAVTTSDTMDRIIWSLVESGDYIYMSDGNYIKKLNKSDLSVVQTSPDYGGEIRMLCISGEYIYAGGSTTLKVRKYTLSDLSLVGESAIYNGSNIIYISAIFKDLLIVGGGSSIARTGLLKAYNLDDLSLVAQGLIGYGNKAIFTDGIDIFETSNTSDYFAMVNRYSYPVYVKG